MNNISETLRTTLLSLKLISDRIKATLNILGVFNVGSTVSSRLDDIENAIDNIDIDTSDLAKQGDNVSATNTAIYTETINNGSLLDQSIAAQLYAIIGEEESESES